MKWIIAYAHLGVPKDASVREVQRILLAHFIGLGMVAVTAPYGPILWWAGAYGLALLIPVISLPYLLMPLETKWLGFTASRAILFTTINLNLYIYGARLGAGAQIHLVTFAAVALPFLTASTQEKKLIAYGVAVPFIVNMAMQVPPYALFGPPILSDDIQHKLMFAILPAAFTILIIAVGSFAVVTQRAQRTLDERNDEMALVLTNVDQGLVTITLNGHLSGEPSAVLEKWFGKVNPGVTIWDYIGHLTHSGPEWMQLAFEQVTAQLLPLDTALEQLPTRLQRNGREYSVSYRSIQNKGVLSRLLVVISDITDELARQRAEAEQHAFAKAIRHLVISRAAFLDFADESSELAKQITSDTSAEVIRRALHTLKGNAALFGLENVAQVCHEAEDLMDQGEPDPAALNMVSKIWSETLEPLKPFLGMRDMAEVPFETLDALADAIRRGESTETLLNKLAELKSEPLRSRFERLSEQARLLAKRLGKGDIEVEVVDRGVALPPEIARGVGSVLVHLVRNAVDHGLETSEVRERSGKSPRAHLSLQASAGERVLEVSISDDGSGIPWDRVREKAIARGVPHQTEKDLVDALFLDGVSTRNETTDVSGRGVGLSAVRDAVRRFGGEVNVETTPNKGTTFRLRVPLRS